MTSNQKTANPQTFATRVSALMERAGLSDSDVALHFSTSRPTVTRWRLGTAEPHPAMHHPIIEWLTEQAAVKPGTLWRHYKGAVYVVERIVRREVDRVLLVEYRDVADWRAPSWSRPLDEFLELLPDGDVRFMKLPDVPELLSLYEKLHGILHDSVRAYAIGRGLAKPDIP